MFAGCTSLTTAPSLPATTLADYCYSTMFSGCTSLTTAPSLPATTLATGCYYWMFNGCYSLTTAPSLPATTLAGDCYGYMFNYCSAITSAPSLPATTLAYSCYSGMFNNCTSLTTAPELPATKLEQGCYQQMFSYCTALTTPPAILPATDLTGCESCYNEMFSYCENLTSVPILPATTLSGGCYMDMFRNCTSLTTGPALPADTLVENCYSEMFFGCTNIQSVITYADDITADGCTSNWLGGEDVWDDEQQMDVSTAPPSGTIYNGGSATYLVDDYSGIPVGWSEASVPTITSVGSVPSTFTAKSWMDKAKVSYTIVGQNTTGIDVPLSNVTEKVNIGVNTGNTSLTYTENNSYDGMYFFYTITQSANDTDEPNYFYVQNDRHMAQNITITPTGTDTAGTYIEEIEWSKDKVNWTTLTIGSSAVTIPMSYNDRVYLRNDNGKFNTQNRYVRIEMTSSTAVVGGDLRTLLDYFDKNIKLSESYQFRDLFRTNAYPRSFLKSASNLVLPFTTLTQSCYYQMFCGCAYLTDVPSLPATTLANYCYAAMFYGCSSLVSAPSLPATTLQQNCYYQMFRDCTSLVTPPALPATNLAQYCYGNMFYGCTSLDVVPSLPATTLARWCYGQMFRDCTSLVTSCELPATTLVESCYQQMFQGCTNLNEVIIYADNINAYGCLLSWLSNVSPTGTFHNFGSVTYPTGTSGIPEGWTLDEPY